MALKKYKYIIAWYFFATYLTFVYLTYALEWRRFSLTPQTTVYFQNQNLEGPLTSFSSSGLGEMKNYYFRINNGPEFMLPACIYDSVFAADEFGNYDPGSTLNNGQYVKVKTTGGKPIVIQLTLKEANGTEKEILPEKAASSRYLYAIRNANVISERYKSKTYWIIPIAVLLHLLFITFRKIFPANKK